jgi:hypothetical protein
MTAEGKATVKQKRTIVLEQSDLGVWTAVVMPVDTNVRDVRHCQAALDLGAAAMRRKMKLAAAVTVATTKMIQEKTNG